MSILVPLLRPGRMSKKRSHNPWPPLPPENETNEERYARRGMETEAKYKSDSIDLQIKLEREERATRPQGPRILLLGQAESGKSTVLKNFQMHLTPKAFKLETEMWRPVIQLNLVRSVNFLIAFISDQGAHRHRGASSPLLSSKIRTLCFRLAPLRSVEEDVVKILSKQPSRKTHNPVRLLENAVTNGTLCFRSAESVIGETDSDRREYGPSRRVLDALGQDIAALWQDESLQQALKLAEIALEEQPGFFLDHAVRVTRQNYKPRPDDVLRARVITLGPVAHTIIAEGSSGRGKQWTIYDVGSSRNQRASWAQFFDDVDAIIFLVPLSGFNQLLDEDENVNRLADSLRLWQMVCSNKLLASVELVLFLNKVDILESKLRSGIPFSSFFPAYGHKPNETKYVTEYLLKLFVALHKQHSSRRRNLHTHLTCAIDTTATANIIQQIQDYIVMKIFSQTEML